MTETLGRARAVEPEWTQSLTHMARQVVGHDLTLNTPHGPQRMVYADWTASGRLYQPIEDRVLREVAPWIALDTCPAGRSREADLLAQLLQADARVALQGLQNGGVEAIEFHAGIVPVGSRIFCEDRLELDVR